MRNFLRPALSLVLPPIALGAAHLVTGWRRKWLTGGRVRLPYGEFMLQCDESHHLPRILAMVPDFGRPLAELVLALEVASPSVIDVGANIGDTALLLARFAPGTRVLCIEGDRRFIPDLTVNTSQIRNVTIAEAILADRTYTAHGQFTSLARQGGTAHITLDQSGDALEMQTLDHVLGRYPEFASPDVIKVDTDGFDPAILRGAACTLRTARPVAFYEWDPFSYDAAGESDLGHAEFLTDLGYNEFLFFTNIGEPMLRVRNPGREVWESLAHYSRVRHSKNGLYYDVAAFPGERQECCERLWRRYAHGTHKVSV